MKRVIWFICFFPIFCCAQFEIHSQRIDSTLEYLHERQLFNGTVLIAKRGQIVYERSVGISNAFTGEALDSRSSFNLASISKQFYTMLVMMLWEDGKLKYDDPVKKHIPDFPYEGITIRHLMNQTSGLSEYFEMADRNMNLFDTLTNHMMLELLIVNKPPLQFPPGSQWQYSNTNYTTLASVIEKASGQDVAKLFNDRITQPLGMQDSYVYHLKMRRSPPSRVFGLQYDQGIVKPNDLLRFDGIIGDGNIYASARDLLKWDQALYSEKLVKESTLAEAFKPAILSDGDTTRYGFGWFIKDRGETLWHTGGWVGFRNIILRDIAHQETLIILTNGTNGMVRQPIENLLDGKAPSLPATELITHVRIIDGSGQPSYQGAVRMVNDRIQDIGPLTAAPGETVTDGLGMVLAPGFIDSHSHHDWGLDKHPACLAATSQGITTIVVGQDGGSVPMDSLENELAKTPASINVASFTGHSTLRSMAMKGNVLRKASPDEIELMKILLKEELEQGSLGLSTGLEYESAFYSNREEVISLAKIASASKARYISHIRSEDVFLDEAIDEIIDIGMQADLPVQVSHMKIARRSRWGTGKALLRKLQCARQHGVDITADTYPYTMWSSTPRVLFPNKDFDNPSSAMFATVELFDPASSVMVRFPANINYEGKTVTEIGEMYGESPDIALLRIIREGEKGGDSGSIVATSMSEEDVADFLRWEHTSICSDGSISGHPRGHGAFTRVLGRYVREKGIMSLEQAIYKMTALPAENLGIVNRGMIAPGYYADLVLFNPDEVSDNATVENPQALSSGIYKVWVNGVLVYQDQKAMRKYPGRLVKRGN